METRERDGNSRATSFDGHWKSMDTTNVPFLTSKGPCIASSNHVTHPGPWYSSCVLQPDNFSIMEATLLVNIGQL